MEEPAGVAPNCCKTSLAPVYGLQSESSPALHLPTSPLLESLIEDVNSALAKFVEDQTVHGFIPIPSRWQRRYYRTSSSSYPGPYSVPPGLASITFDRVSETKKRCFFVSLSSFCFGNSAVECLWGHVVAGLVTSTCGGFREHLSGEIRANFERLMLSGWRALEFLGGQGVAALRNLVLSRQDSLLLDVRCTVPVEEVALLRHASLPSTASLFPPSLLETALTKMLAASNDALVQKTLHPPRIPKKSVLVQGKASSSASSAADRGVILLLFFGPSSLRSRHLLRPPPGGGRLKAVRVRLPFRKPPAALAGPVASKRGPESGQHDVPAAPLRVGACLAPHWRRWQAIGAESWVVSVLQDGYHVPFLDSLPQLARSPVSFPTYRAESPRSLALLQEIEMVLAKGALEIVLDPEPGFYSRLFLVEKATGGWRPVIDLSPLNGSVRQTPFKMETVASVLLSVWEGDFLASVDLKDAYFQIPVHRSSRKLLRFTSEGTVYQFKVLCFRLWTAPQVFTRVFAAVSAWVHSRGILLLLYLDDWLVLASSEAVARQHVRELLSLCHSLGIVINDEKSDLVPLQYAAYLGITIDTVAAKVFPTLAQVEKFLPVAEQFLTVTTPLARLWQVLLGHLSSLEKLVPHGRLRMRSLQWHLKTHWSPESDPPDLPVPRSLEVEEDLSWWMVRDRLLMGVPFGTLAPDLHLYLDASWSGWDAHLLDRSVSGVWSVQESSLHIAHQSPWDKSLIPGSSVLPGDGHGSPCDSDVRQLDGGCLHQQARRDSVWLPLLVDQATSPMGRVLRCPVGGEVSAGAVQCSGRSPQPSGAGYRVRVVSPSPGGESTPSCLGFFVAGLVRDAPQRKASRVLLPRPGSPGRLRGCVQHPWDGLDVYAFPPFLLVGRVVAWVRETPNLSMTLVAPLWPEKGWFADLLLLLTQPPLALPRWDRLLRQPHFNHFHQGVHTLNLHAWRLSSVPSKSQAFREGLRLRCPIASGSPLPACTRLSGSPSVVGVVEGALFQSTPLFPS